jgi:hypothetical protein
MPKTSNNRVQVKMQKRNLFIINQKIGVHENL